MALERIHHYHLVRALRVIVPILLVVFASAFAFIWLTRPIEAPSAPGSERLGEDVASLTEERVFSQGRDDCTLYRVSTREDRAYVGGVRELEDVEVVVGGCGGAPERRIRGLRCGIRQLSDEAVDIGCEGGVEVELDPGTVVRTEQLAYQYPAEKISATAPVEIVREGGFRMRADRMTALPREGLYDLEGEVQVVRADGERLAADVLRYDEGAGLVTAAGRLEVHMGSLRVAGHRGQAWLEPVTLELRRVEVREAVRVSSLESGVPGSLTARELDVETAGESGTRVWARGEAVAESGSGPGARTLSGDAIVGVLDAAGRLGAFEAAGDAALRLGTGEVIRSATIRQLDDGSLETGENSRLESADLTVVGREFRIRRGDEVRFETASFASIQTPEGLFEGDSTRAVFDSAAGTLASLEQTGSVRFELEGVEGRADRMVTGEQWVEMFGRARLADGVSELESDMIRLGRASGALRAEGSVFLIARSADPPVFVQSARLQSAGDGEPLDFTGGALLRRDQTEVSAGRIEVDPDGGAFLAEGEVDSVMTDMRVRSDRLRFDEGAGRVEYSGNVHAETSEFTLRSGWLGLDVERGEVGRVEAAEAVSVVSVAGVRAAGEEALYDRESGTLTVYGPASEVVDPENGRCTGEEIVITLESRDVAVRGGQADRAVCSPPVAPHTSTTGG